MSQKRKLKKVLFIMDPIEKLDPRWDNSLALIRELVRRGSLCWLVDGTEVRLENGAVWVHASPLTVSGHGLLRTLPARHCPLKDFHLAVFRKEPPFNMAYYALTLILDHAPIPVVNHPRGIRDANEKMWGLSFKHLMPETLISASSKAILRFGRQFKDGFVVKPLNEKGGRGIFKVEEITPAAKKQIETACMEDSEVLVCQRFLKQARGIDKRIVLLDGKILCAFEKHPSKKDFRANLGLGATAHPTHLSTADIRIVKTLLKPLQRTGLFLAGLDVMDGKLLEINVTSPAGMTDAEALDPRGKFIAAWADWLELFYQRRDQRPH